MKAEAIRTPDRVNPEWTREDFVRAVSFSALPAKLQQKLLLHRKPCKLTEN